MLQFFMTSSAPLGKLKSMYTRNQKALDWSAIVSYAQCVKWLELRIFMPKLKEQFVSKTLCEHSCSVWFVRWGLISNAHWLPQLISIYLGFILCLTLTLQKSYHQIAEDKKLFLVEQREENENLPVVLAVPSTCRTEEEIPTDESLDFRQVRFMIFKLFTCSNL